MASDTILVEWCDYHEAAGKIGLDCWGAGLDGQDSCDKTTRLMRLVPVDLTLYRMVDRLTEDDPDPWIDGSEQCMTGNHLYVPLFPDDSDKGCGECGCPSFRPVGWRNR